MNDDELKRIPLHLFYFNKMTAFKRLSGFGRALRVFRKSIDEDLQGIGASVDGNLYLVASFFSALFYGILFGTLIFVLALVMPEQKAVAQKFGIGFGFLLFFLFFFLHVVHPGIIKRKIAVRQNKDLLFGLREIIMSVDSGVPLFDSMKNVSLANYGYLSKDFSHVVKKIESGVFERDALQSLAIQSENEYLRRAAWQIINALETGSKVSSALSSITDVLEKQINREIKDYSSNLNFIMLIYMLIAAAIPSLGVTFMVLLSAFSGAGVSQITIFFVLGTSFFIQAIVLGYAAATRPAIFGA
ncbi:type II secretion system F family protein [Candidatus Micrarchaeota archaeon]|nr:type II secretion system F family protein [Candidatus Micrarchaeota archaeon]